MTKKAVAICVLIGIIAGLLGACSIGRSNQTEDTHTGVLSNVSNDASKFAFTEYFIKVGGIGEYSFVYDKYTKVMYAEYFAVGGFSSMTVLFNADGTVMTLDDWNNLEPDLSTDNTKE